MPADIGPDVSVSHGVFTRHVIPKAGFQTVPNNYQYFVAAAGIYVSQLCNMINIRNNTYLASAKCWSTQSASSAAVLTAAMSSAILRWFCTSMS